MGEARQSPQRRIWEDARGERDRLYSVFMQAPMPVAIVRGPEFVYELSNPANQFYIGAQDVVGKRVRDLDRGSQELIQLLERVYATGERYVGRELPVEFRGAGPPEIHYIDFVYEPVRGPDGSVEAILVCGNNVTEAVLARKRAEDKEAEFRQLVNAIPQIVWTADASGSSVYVNHRWWEYTGLRQEAFRQGDEIEVIHPEDRARVRELTQRSFREGVPFDAQYRLRASSGEYRWHLGRLWPLRDAEGSVKQWFGTATDIDEQKRSELEFKALAQAVPGFVWKTGLDGRMLFANPAFAEYTGLTADELNRKGWQEVIHPDDLARLASRWTEALEAGASNGIRFRLKGKDGSYRWMIRHSHPVRDSSGRVISLVGTTTDVHELIEAQERFQAFFELAGHGAGIVEAGSGRFLQVNERLCEMTGYSRSELLEKNFHDITHPDDRDGDRGAIEAVLRLGKSKWRTEKRYVRKDGGVIWVQVDAAMVRDERGRPQYGVATIQDVTDRRRFESALKESEARFRQLAEAMPQLVWINAPEGGTVYFNSQWCEYTGRGVEESLGAGWTRALHPDDVEPVARAWSKAAETGGLYESESRIRRRDGAYRWFLNRAYPVKDGDGRIVRWFGTCTDIHELVEAQSRFGAFFRQASLPMMIYATDGRAMDANPAWARLFQSSLDQLEGYNLLEDAQAEAEGVVACIRRALAGEPTEVPKFRYDPAASARQGRERWLEATFFPVKDRSGSVREVAMILRDVTDREHAEQRLRESNEQLERAVRAREDLMNICGHELKTPLSSLKLQTQTAKRRIAKGDASVYEPAKVRKLLDSYEGQIERLVRLVNDMLDISRISGGKLSLSPERFALHKLVLEVLDRFSDQLGAAGCAISTSLAPDVVGAWDRFRIEQVLTNLLTNAMKYGKGAPIAVSVGKTPDGSATIEVRDEGIGIAPEHHERIFDRFERAISADEVSGLGLGLFIAREIVTAHGGRISVRSSPGRGATFSVELPLEGRGGHA